MSNISLDKEHVNQIIYDLAFAYINKDEDFPHDFEVKALENTHKYAKEHGDEKLVKFIEIILNEIKNKLNY